MDASNYDTVIEMAKNDTQKNKVQMILNELFPGENVDVPDPYYGLANGFENVYQMLDEVCDVIAKKIIETAKQNNVYVHESTELVSLLMQVDLDAAIPPQLYVVVAELLAWLYHLERDQAFEGGLSDR